MSDEILTLQETAELLRVHPSTIYRLLKARKIPSFKVGRDWKFSRNSLDAWRHEAELKAQQ
jgi:excisionase family DNA binding protein